MPKISSKTIANYRKKHPECANMSDDEVEKMMRIAKYRKKHPNAGTDEEVWELITKTKLEQRKPSSCILDPFAITRALFRK